MDQPTKDLPCGFTENARNITKKVINLILSNVRGNDNLRKVGMEISQKYFSHFQTGRLVSLSIHFAHSEKRYRDHNQDFKIIITLD